MLDRGHDHEVVLARHGTWRTIRQGVLVEPGYRRALEPAVLDYYFWAVLGGGRTVLVDTGSSAVEAARRGRTIVRTPDAHFAGLGIGPTWHGDVVLTHLHYDHTGGVSQLPGATFHVARAEWDFRLSADQSDAALTSTDDLAALRAAGTDGRVVLHDADADAELVPGVWLISAPGHTPGQLMVAVQTTAGRVVLASDAAHFDEEYLEDTMFTSMTDPGSAPGVYARLRAMRAAGDEVVTGHEPGLVHRYGAGTPYGPETAVVRPVGRAAAGAVQ